MAEAEGAARPWRPVDGGLAIEVQVQPGARADAVEGCTTGADGACVLKVRLKAPPADGQANDALVKLLAKRWRLPKSAVVLAAGRSQRRKRLHLKGDPDRLAARLRDGP
jgi:hypothetical protein